MLIGAIALAIVAGGSASAAKPQTLKITINAMAFAAAPAAIKVGDTIEWINQDIVDHTSTDKKKPPLWNVSIAPGKSARVVMKTAGTFDYYCRYHPNMIGRVIVGGPGKKSTQ
jgi:plastocyanin